MGTGNSIGERVVVIMMTDSGITILGNLGIFVSRVQISAETAVVKIGIVHVIVVISLVAVLLLPRGAAAMTSKSFETLFHALSVYELEFPHPVDRCLCRLITFPSTSSHFSPSFAARIFHICSRSSM